MRFLQHAVPYTSPTIPVGRMLVHDRFTYVTAANLKRIKKTRFFNWCRTLDAIIGYRRILFGSEVQESFIITPKMLWILKKIRLHFS